MPNEAALLIEWMNRLGLQDWLIDLQTNVKEEDMATPNSDGCVSYDETIKAAKIQISDGKTDENVMRLRPFNFEETLVHELLHLKFCLLERGSDWENKCQLRVLHQIIDDLARALVRAKEHKDEE